MKRQRLRNTTRLGIAGLVGAGMLILTFAPSANAGPRDRRDAVRSDSHRGHAERGHDDERGHRRDVDRNHRRDERHEERLRRERRFDRRSERRFERRFDRHSERRFERRFDRRHRHMARFDVPKRLQRGHMDRYQSYYSGRRYFRPHGHYHEAYSFPVRTRWGWEPRSHFYCEGSLLGGIYVSYSGRNFDLGLQF